MEVVSYTHLFMGINLGSVVSMALLKTHSYMITFEELALLQCINLLMSFMIRSTKESTDL